MQQGDLPSTSVKLGGRETLRQLPSTFRAARRHSVNFCLHSVWPGDLLSTSVYSPYCRETFHKLSSTFHAARRPVKFLCSMQTFRQLLSTFLRPGELPLSSVSFPSGRKTFRQFPSTFCAAGRPSITFRKHSLRPGYLSSTSARKFHRSWLKLSLPQEELMVVYRKSTGHTKIDASSSQKESSQKIMEDLPAARKFDGS